MASFSVIKMEFNVFVKYPIITWSQKPADNKSTPTTESFEGNVAEKRRRWIQQFRLYLNPTGLHKKPAQGQCSTLLTVAGEEALEIFHTFGLTEEDKVKIDIVIRKFEEYCTPKKNVRAACV